MNPLSTQAESSSPSRRDESTGATVLPWWKGWGPLIALPAMTLFFLPSDWPRWAFMWVLAFAIYCGCKWLTWRRTPAPGVPRWKHFAYLLAWPGLNATAFLKEAAVNCPTRREWMAALGKTMLGVWLLFGAARLVPPDRPYLTGWVGMTGIAMLLHFGTFHLLSCWWRWWGVKAEPLMNRPLAAVSISEFWGRRWNLAFRDFTHRFLFRALFQRFGPRTAVFLGFVFSGLIHDFVISVPAGGGYGGPTLYFLLQGMALFAERSSVGRQTGLGRGRRGWLFTAVCILGPVPLLFHQPFVLNVVVPFLQILGAVA